MVSGDVLTAEPVEVALRAVLASALFAALRAALPAISAAPAAAVILFAGGCVATTVPARGRLVCVPLTGPPPVLT
jgi:hypothetical protein